MVNSLQFLHQYRFLREQGPGRGSRRAAAERWNVGQEICQAENHHVINKESGEKIFFGDLVEAASKQPVPENLTFKERKDFKYIGGELPSIDVDDYTGGKAIYGMDVKITGMKYAAVSAISPVYLMLDVIRDVISVISYILICLK